MQRDFLVFHSFHYLLKISFAKNSPYGNKKDVFSFQNEGKLWKKIAFPRFFSDGEVASHFKQFHDDASLPKESFSRSVGREKLSP